MRFQRSGQGVLPVRRGELADQQRRARVPELQRPGQQQSRYPVRLSSSISSETIGANGGSMTMGWLTRTGGRGGWLRAAIAVSAAVISALVPMLKVPPGKPIDEDVGQHPGGYRTGRARAGEECVGDDLG